MPLCIETIQIIQERRRKLIVEPVRLAAVFQGLLSADHTPDTGETVQHENALRSGKECKKISNTHISVNGRGTRCFGAGARHECMIGRSENIRILE